MLTNTKMNMTRLGFASTEIRKFMLDYSVFSNHSNYLVVQIVR